MVLEIGNSYSRITGLNTSQFKELAEILSYRVSPSEAYYNKGRSPVRCLLGKRGDFPSGLLHYVSEWAHDRKYPLETRDTRVVPKPTPGMFKLVCAPTPRAYQQEAVDLVAAFNRAGLEMVTGSGKSYTMALLIHKLQMKALVIVPNLGLKAQLQASFAQWFGGLNNIVVENIDSTTLKRPSDHDVLIIDETHHSSSSSYRKLNRSSWKNIYHRYFFTGTFFRSQDNEQLLLESIAGQCVYEFGYKEAVEAGAVVPAEAYYYDLPAQEMEGNPFHWGAVYSELVVNNKPRNALIVQLLRRLHSQGKSTLCLIKEIAHGNLLSEATGFPFANGQDGMSGGLIKGFNDGLIKTLIGTTGVLGEGVDTKPAEYLILAAGGKSKNSFMQQLGRGFRTYPGKESCKAIMFRDRSSKYLLKHFNVCVRYLKDEYGIKPALLTTE